MVKEKRSLEGKTTEKQCIIVRLFSKPLLAAPWARALPRFEGKCDMFPLWQPYRERGLSSRVTSARGGPLTQTGVRKAFGAVSSQAENQRVGGEPGRDASVAGPGAFQSLPNPGPAGGLSASL